MLIPYGTTAPIYHRPYGTIVIIVINTVMFVATGGQSGLLEGFLEERSTRWLILEFDRINPLQWITSAFMHASWMHLIGNMIFLWCFGLIVEGKLGWKKYALLYAAIALIEGAVVQIPMFVMGSPGGALGASGVIFGLMAVSMVWAPDNEIRCIFIFSFWFVRAIEIPVWGFAAFYLALQLLGVYFTGAQLSSEMLHLVGMFSGFPPAFYLLRTGKVDCEGYDLVSRSALGSDSSLPIYLPESWQTFLGPPASSRRQTQLSDDVYRKGQEAIEMIRRDPSRFNPAQTDQLPPPAKRAFVRSSDQAMDLDGLFDDETLPGSSAVSAPPPRARRVHRVDADEFYSLSRSLDEAVSKNDSRRSSKVFSAICQSGQSARLGTRQVGRLANLLTKHRMYRLSIDPLRLLADREGPLRNQACIRLGLIYWQLDQDGSQARQILEKMSDPIDRELRRKRRKLLAAMSDSVVSASP